MSQDTSSQRAGIKQIADALNISIGTVDRALHGRDGVSPKTRELVLKMAKKLNYSPNIAARNLKLNRHFRIGVFLPKQIASFFDPLRAGIRAGANAIAASTVELVFHTYPRLRVGDVETMEANNWKQFDGIILAPGNPSRLSSICKTAEEVNKPLVYVATDAPRTHRLSSIAVEAATSGGIAAELLGQVLPSGGTVVVITGDLMIQDHADKLRGFAGSLATLAPHLRMLPAIESHESPENARRATLETIRKHPELSGIYVSTANSIPVIKALEESGKLGMIRVIATDLFPELAPLIEGNNILATLNQRPFRQGRLAFEILTRFLISGLKPKPTIRLAPHIVLRSNLPLFLEGNSSELQGEDALVG